MYHSAPATRFNNISPSSRSNYQLASMRDFTRQQTLQTSFIENGNGNHHQRLMQQQQTLNASRGGTGNGLVNGNGNGLSVSGNGGGGGGASDLLQQQNASPFHLNDGVNGGVDLLAQPPQAVTVSTTGGGGPENERLTRGNSNKSNGHSAPP